MRILILFFIFFSSSIFGANCPVYISAGNVDFSQVNVDQSVALDIHIYRFSTSNQCKNYDLGITSGSANSYSRKLYNGANTLNYNIYKDDSTSTALRSLNDAQNNSQRIRFQMNSWYTKLTVYVRLPYWGNSTVLQNGLYTDTTQIQVYPRGNNSGGGSRNLTTNLNVQSDINISLVGRGGQYDENQTSYSLDFGTMSAGKVRSFDLIVKSNTGYRINVSSEYDGSLAHNDQSNYKVGYNFGVNGSDMSLVGSKSSPKQIYSSNSASQNGQVIEVDITLLNTSGKLSGSYTDYIYFTAISN
ncbi:spore coat protein U domain-containing protein [Halobacteriovorax sp.]|uniref:spore coat protein U domain-containing protein n=1 Tax=Halobacteriovorax sp. TaxID=2020862 RepID=UPI003566CFCD